MPLLILKFNNKLLFEVASFDSEVQADFDAFKSEVCVMLEGLATINPAEPSIDDEEDSIKPALVNTVYSSTTKVKLARQPKSWNI